MPGVPFCMRTYAAGCCPGALRASFTRTALNSLSEIRAYIGKDNPAATNRVSVQIVAACDRLEYLPA